VIGSHLIRRSTCHKNVRVSFGTKLGDRHARPHAQERGSHRKIWSRSGVTPGAARDSKKISNQWLPLGSRKKTRPSAAVEKAGVEVKGR
jgi:hypothetical protein